MASRSTIPAPLDSEQPAQPSAAFLRQYAVPSFRQKWCEDQLAAVIAIQIREIRLQRGWTQDELARRAGLTQPAISLLESGTYDYPTPQTLQKIARAFGCALMIRFESHGEFVAFVFAIYADGVCLIPDFEHDKGLAVEPQTRSPR